MKVYVLFVSIDFAKEENSKRENMHDFFLFKNIFLSFNMWGKIKNKSLYRANMFKLKRAYEGKIKKSHITNIYLSDVQ